MTADRSEAGAAAAEFAVDGQLPSGGGNGKSGMTTIEVSDEVKAGLTRLATARGTDVPGVLAQVAKGPDRLGYWVPWLTSAGAVAVIAVFQLVTSPFATVNVFAVSVRAGDYLIAGLAACVATIVQWWYEVARSLLPNIGGTILTLICGLALVAGIAVFLSINNVKPGSSLTPGQLSDVWRITFICLAAGFALGFFPLVGLSAGWIKERHH
jgi:hypothetical protein